MLGQYIIKYNNKLTHKKNNGQCIKNTRLWDWGTDILLSLRRFEHFSVDIIS